MFIRLRHLTEEIHYIIALLPCFAVLFVPDSLTFEFNDNSIYLYFHFPEIEENPFFYYEYYYNFYDPNTGPDVDCFLDHLVFRNNYTDEEFRPQDKGDCHSSLESSLIIAFSHRDYFEVIVTDFLSNGSLPDGFGIEMYFDDPSQVSLDLPEYTSEIPLLGKYNFYLGNGFILNRFDFWLNEGIVLMHFETVVSYESVNVSKLSFSNSINASESNTVNITSAVVLSDHPSGFTRSLPVKLNSNDLNEMQSKHICTAHNSVSRNCYLSLGSEFVYSFYGVSNFVTRVYSTNNVRGTTPCKLLIIIL